MPDDMPTHTAPDADAPLTPEQTTGYSIDKKAPHKEPHKDEHNKDRDDEKRQDHAEPVRDGGPSRRSSSSRT